MNQEMTEALLNWLMWISLDALLLIAAVCAYVGLRRLDKALCVRLSPAAIGVFAVAAIVATGEAQKRLLRGGALGDRTLPNVTAEDSCTAHEFNVTKYLKPGENLLAVEVYRWSDGSFLEDQDFFRYSGIYRHVMLFSPPQVEIRDFFWKPTLAADFKSATVDLSVELRDLRDRGSTS